MRRTTSVDLGELREPFLAQCAIMKMSPSNVLRGLVERVIAEPPSGRFSALKNPLARTVAGDIELGESIRVELRLRPSEYTMATALAQAEGYARINPWLVAVVRARVAGGEFFSAEERGLLGESTRQLRAIGRNLNQMARLLNTQPAPPSGDQAAKLLVWFEEVGPLIRRHVLAAERVFDAGARRWRLELRNRKSGSAGSAPSSQVRRAEG